jgi:hypothetical protein
MELRQSLEAVRHKDGHHLGGLMVLVVAIYQEHHQIQSQLLVLNVVGVIPFKLLPIFLHGPVE